MSNQMITIRSHITITAGEGQEEYKYMVYDGK